MYSTYTNHCIPVLVLTAVLLATNVSGNLWCYKCVSSEPGCTVDAVNWFIHSAITCPRSDDKCVKIIDRKGSDLLITRDCLSNIIPFRRDIPADRFEGCRPAATQPKLAVYVDNSVRELDLKKDYFSDTTYCFCEFDEWCNHSLKMQSNYLIIFTIALLSLILFH
ncbi:unnamed protein product [Medioppia subpectinata]|uniref:Protein quiver n=1 Tax=Medioppia subpectinata TaxID=1979941 RepID=A0A7R9PWR7_9ACAR|nr:unnamed protein product [Medioppia subpectinata]CAG2103185.1 unnamed protein product [Medioppia subpectinata]